MHFNNLFQDNSLYAINNIFTSEKSTFVDISSSITSECMNRYNQKKRIKKQFK